MILQINNKRWFIKIIWSETIMTTEFVRRGISLYRNMDENARVFYRNMLGLNVGSKMVDVENALAKFEYMKNNIHELIEEMEDDVEHLKQSTKTKK